jgi:multidrug efflux pump subunit AcrA (membrane-fusion protein)
MAYFSQKYYNIISTLRLNKAVSPESFTRGKRDTETQIMESRVTMKTKIIAAIILTIALTTLGFASCGGEPEETERQITIVERGDLIVSIPADGNLDMPRELDLSFSTYGTVEKIYVEKGQEVKEGQLIAKLDDTIEKLNVSLAQYQVELAMNELVQKIHPALMGYPESYPDPSTIFRLEQAQEELKQAEKFLDQGKYQEAAAELRLAIHDLEASHKMLNVPEIALTLQQRAEVIYTPVDKYPDISRAIRLLEQDIARLAEIQALIEQGSYEDAEAELDAAQSKLSETHQRVEILSGRIRVSQRIGECCQQQAAQQPETSPGLTVLPYPDISTTLNWLNEVEEDLQKIQLCKASDSCDELELATLLRMAQHDVDMSQMILENNELVFRGGVNLKALRAYNLNLQRAEKNLEGYKKQLMWTEILAPFDGTVVDIYVKEGQEILTSMSVTATAAVSTEGSAVSTSGGAATPVIHLVDTRTVEMDGVVDEIDIYKAKVGQEAIIIVDALPDVELRGKVTFVSPFGTQPTGIVEFPVTISLEPTDIELKGGLTATADIIVEEHPNVLLIPNRSIKGSPGDYWVEVVIDEEKLTTEKRPVVLGAQSERLSEVVSGLSEGERIIVEATRSQISTFF